MIRRSFLSILSITVCSLLSTVKAQTLFTYGNKAVSKEEFLKAYNKNSTGEKPTEQSYREYYDLYTRFKVKVQAALDMKLDTLGNLNAELQNFRNQIAETFLNDDRSVQDLIDEAYVRSQKDIRIAHIFIPAAKTDSSAAIKAAESRINKAYEALQQKSFQDVALAYSEDPAVKSNKGDIGFITVFILPYSIETVVYNLSPGQYSKPFRSSAGFHIIKNVEERPAIGRIRAAQILLASTDDQQSEASGILKKKSDSVYEALQHGADFKKLALQLSNDNLSYENGGELPEFGVGRYDPAFELAAFSLQKDGDIAKPVLTEFGYHIIKRLSRTPPAHDKNDEQWRESVKQLILQNDRMEVARRNLLKATQQKINFKKLPYNQKSLWRLTDSILEGRPAPKLADLNSNTPLFSFTKQTLRVKDFQNYLESIRNIQSLVAGKSNQEIFDQFVETSSLSYYREHLEEFNRDFVYQLNEFKEGNLLFEVMQRKIWDAASGDSLVLKQFYERNRGKYWWENSADAIIFTCNNEEVAERLRKAISTDPLKWRQAVDKGEGSIQADSGRFELAQIPVVDRTNFTKGLITANVKNDGDNTITFAYIINLHPTREPRNFEDAKGFVINDYQEFLENEWVTGLKKKYPIKLNETVFGTLPK